MTIKVGDPLPTASFKHLTDDGLGEITTEELFASGKSVLFGVPGAFTLTCSNQHLPGFAANLDKLKAKGVKNVACVAVNDPFVMKAWGERDGAPGIIMLSDWDASFTKALGLDKDGSAAGLGIQSQRYAMVVEDGIVTRLSVEEGRGMIVSSAEAVLDQL